MKYEYRHNDDGTTTIFIRGGLETTISTSDFGKVSSYEGTWYRNKVPSGYRVQCELWGRKGKTSRKVMFLHRFIMDPPNNMQVDHINMNQLDNRRENLRIVTNAENQQNRRSYKNSSTKVRGVSWDKARNKYKAAIRKDGKTYGLGRFNTIEEAEKVVIAARKELFTHSVEGGI